MIYADENVWAPVAEGLRRRDWEVTTARDAETLGFSDREHLEFATERGWLLLTFDDDFARLAATEFAGVNHAGIIYVSQHGRDVGELVRRVDATLQRIDSRDVTEEIIYAERSIDARCLDSKATSRPLNAPSGRRKSSDRTTSSTGPRMLQSDRRGDRDRQGSGRKVNERRVGPHDSSRATG